MSKLGVIFLSFYNYLYFTSSTENHIHTFTHTSNLLFVPKSLQKFPRYVLKGKNLQDFMREKATTTMNREYSIDSYKRKKEDEDTH